MIAVIGCGLWGMNIIRTLARLEHLCAVCDTDVEKSKRIGDDFSVPSFSFQDILEKKEILGVVLSVPVPFHLEYACQALKAGKHVWIEKPMTLSVEEAEHICALAEAHDRKVLVGHVIQYHDAFQEMLRQIESGAIGNILTVDAVRRGWGRVCPWEKDALWSLGVHDLSMVLRLVNQPAIKAQRYTQNYVQGGDQITLFLQFMDGIHAKIVSNWAYPLKEQRFVVIGSQGSLVFDDTAPDGKELTLYRHAFSDTPPFIQAEDSQHVAYAYESSPIANECLHFIDSIVHNTPVRTSCQEALQGIQLLSQAEEVAG